MPAFKTKAIIPYLEGILAGLTGMQHVQRGEPVDPPANVNVYVMVGGQQPTRVATGGIFTRTGRYLVQFAIRVGGEEDDAEDLIADLYDEFEDALLAHPTGQVAPGDTALAVNIELNTAPADNPEYRRMYGPEFRIYPFEVVVTQRGRIQPS